MRQVILAAGLLAAAGTAHAQLPAGLARSILERTGVQWVHRTTAGFRVYFLAGSYAAQHQDSLLRLLAPALQHARDLIDAPRLGGPIDLFFVEDRATMKDLAGVSGPWMAQPASRTVVLVTSPEWRSFERREIMRVVAQEAWGPPAPGTEWLQEGLAQFADGRCGGYRNADVLIELTRDEGWLAHEDLFSRFRELPGLRASLHAAAFVEYLHQRYGPAGLKALWTSGATAETRIGGDPLGLVARVWRTTLMQQRTPKPAEMRHLKASGCGV